MGRKRERETCFFFELLSGRSQGSSFSFFCVFSFGKVVPSFISTVEPDE